MPDLDSFTLVPWQPNLALEMSHIQLGRLAGEDPSCQCRGAAFAFGSRRIAIDALGPWHEIVSH